MIYIDRSIVDAPKVLSASKMVREKKRMHEFFAGNKMRKQMEYSFKPVHRDESLQEAVHYLFNNKCAYCESLLDFDSFSSIDHFRPTSNAMNLDGSVQENLYWWLAYEWENLYACCQMCNNRKHTRFPVQGRRIKYSEAVSKEAPQLLDPCNKRDFGMPHMYLDAEGRLHSLSEKGEITINILSLNRATLTENRKKRYDQMLVLVTQLAGLDEQSKKLHLVQRQMATLLSPTSAYTGAAQYYFNALTKIAKPIYPTFFERFVEEIMSEVLIQTILDTNVKPLLKEESPPPIKERAYSMGLASDEEKEAYFTSAKHIQRIEIVNFKIIKNLILEFPKPRHKQEPWLVLLGENGTGKSSVMQAIALTLAGEERANSLGLDASRFVNRNTDANTGYVRIFLEGIEGCLELRFSKDSKKFTSNYKSPKVILLAFGSTRLMGDDSSADTVNNLTNLRNLFDPFATLPNVESWVANPNSIDEHTFDQIAIALKQVLQLPEDKLIYRHRRADGNYELYVKTSQDKEGIKIRELSAGYQAIIIMMLNIIKEILSTWKNYRIAEGIVLIDEIGVHLHPKWKLQIISTLREIFPKMNFIITTHEPLCLRGINEGEVALMKMDENNQVIALTDLPSPKGLTIEQLITSKFFGLITSFDPEVEAQLNTFYLLKSKLNPTSTELEKLKKVKKELQQVRVLDSEENLGTTREQQIKLEHTSLDAGWVNNPKHQAELKERIKAIWNKKTV